MNSSSSSSASAARAEAPRGGLWTALALVTLYFCWGSTFLANRLALDGIGPYLVNAVRFLGAGFPLYGWLRLRGEPPMALTGWLWAVPIALFLFVGGAGLLVIAQQWITSALAATILALIPLWTVLIASIWERARPKGLEMAGIAVGFGGVVLLHLDSSVGGNVLGVAVVLLAGFTWAFGSVLSRRATVLHRPLGSAVQMITGGFIVLVLGLLRGEPILWPLPLTALAGELFLITMGSIVGFSVYLYLLQVTRPAVATSYAFTNPLVASLLGWAVLGEPVSLVNVIAMAVIMVGVALVLSPAWLAEIRQRRKGPQESRFR